MQEQEDGWRPIETAPKDGTEIRARGFNWGDKSLGRHRALAFWDGARWREADDEDATLLYLTHWRPLPAPPAQGGDKTEDTLDGQ